MSIGIGITTHNRPDLLARALEAHEKHLPEGATLVVVDDASETPAERADFRFERQAGIARAKNKCLELLVDAGCEHLFLFDDDTWPEADDWWKPYVESAEPHLMYTFAAERLSEADGVAEYPGPNGVMLYVERRVLDKVGGMDPRFGIWGHEHISWSDRIFSAGLTTFRYQDIADHDDLIYACDERERIEQTVPRRVRARADHELVALKRHTSEYIDFRQGAPLTPVGPVVDVVFLARSDSPEAIAMTRRAISTCVERAGREVNVIVVEQIKGVRYEGAKMIYRTGKFRYNAFANIGAKAGSAPWVMIANTDLLFGENWLQPLLDAKHPVVSPISPNDRRQRDIRWNELGTQTGRHFSGWCFMISRDLWLKIDGFDQDFVFWCADDSVIEQVTAAGVTPMVVGDSRVRHLVSQSGGTENPDLTWAMVHKFNKKYGKQRLADDPRYLQWKQAKGVA